MTAEADASCSRWWVNFLYPCLIFENVLNNDALRVPSNLALAPLCGFLIMAVTIIGSLYAGRALGLTQGHGLRTFAFAVGINNYGYIPIPLMNGAVSAREVGRTAGAQRRLRSGDLDRGYARAFGPFAARRLAKNINAPVIALVLALAGNLLGLGPHVPDLCAKLIHQSAILRDSSWADAHRRHVGAILRPPERAVRAEGDAWLQFASSRAVPTALPVAREIPTLHD